MFYPKQQIGVYSLIKRIGRGGFGEVWLAEKQSQFFTKKVAIKLPLDEQVDFEAIRQEATLWEQASGHSNVLPIIDADIYNGQVVIVSEYADGGSLADKIKKEGKLSIKQSVEIIIGILNGLEYLHNKQIIHRDVKPANILLQNDTPRLADFGISRAMQTSGISSKISGTDAYMSPESFKGVRTVETDVWSVGVVLYELINGKLPFPQQNPSERIYSILHEDCSPLSKDIPFDLCQIVIKALVKLPENRYRSVGKMRDELKSFLRNSEFVSPPSTKSATNKNLKSLDAVPNNLNLKSQEEVVTEFEPKIDLPKTQAPVPPPQKTLPAIQFNLPVNNNEGLDKPTKINNYPLYIVTTALIGLCVMMLIFVFTSITSKFGNSNTQTGNYNKTNLATNILMPISPQSTPIPNYDIPYIKANVEELKLFESGEVTPPKEERKYGANFYKSNTRYINYEINLNYSVIGEKELFFWMKFGTKVIPSFIIIGMKLVLKAIGQALYIRVVTVINLMELGR